MPLVWSTFGGSFYGYRADLYKKNIGIIAGGILGGTSGSVLSTTDQINFRDMTVQAGSNLPNVVDAAVSFGDSSKGVIASGTANDTSNNVSTIQVYRYIDAVTYVSVASYGMMSASYPQAVGNTSFAYVTGGMNILVDPNSYYRSPGNTFYTTYNHTYKFTFSTEYVINSMNLTQNSFGAASFSNSTVGVMFGGQNGYMTIDPNSFYGKVPVFTVLNTQVFFYFATDSMVNGASLINNYPASIAVGNMNKAVMIAPKTVFTPTGTDTTSPNWQDWTPIYPAISVCSRGTTGWATTYTFNYSSMTTKLGTSLPFSDFSCNSTGTGNQQFGIFTSTKTYGVLNTASYNYATDTTVTSVALSVSRIYPSGVSPKAFGLSSI